MEIQLIVNSNARFPKLTLAETEVVSADARCITNLNYCTFYIGKQMPCNLFACSIAGLFFYDDNNTFALTLASSASATAFLY